MHTTSAKIFFIVVAMVMACRFLGRIFYITKAAVSENYAIHRPRFLDFTELVGMRMNPGWFTSEVLRCPNLLIGVDAAWVIGYLWLLYQQKFWPILAFLMFFLLMKVHIELAKHDIWAISGSLRKPRISDVWMVMSKRYIFYGLVCYGVLWFLNKP